MSDRKIYSILVIITLFTGTFALLEARTEAGNMSIAKEDLVEIVENEDPQAAMEKLKEVAMKDPYVSRSCHYMVHMIGRASYDKYQDLNKSWNYIDEWCSGGFIHGNIHEYFDQRDTLPEEFNTCSQFENNSSYRWNCIHGTGNAFVMFTDNDLDRSINLCENNFDLERRQKACIDGLYVQHFRNIPEMENNSDYSYPESAFETCNEAKSQYKEQCYKYVTDHYQEDEGTGILEMSGMCLGVNNSSLSRECVDNLYYMYGYSLIFEASKLTSGVNIISSLEPEQGY